MKRDRDHDLSIWRMSLRPVPAPALKAMHAEAVRAWYETGLRLDHAHALHKRAADVMDDILYEMKRRKREQKKRRK